MSRSLLLALLVWLAAGTPVDATAPVEQPAEAVRLLPAGEQAFELSVLLERVRAAARAGKPRDRELKAQVERLRERAGLASPRPDEERGTHDFGESKQPVVIIEGDARAFVAKSGALQVSRVIDGVLVVDGDVEVGFARDAVIVATGAVSVANDYDSVIVGGLQVRVSHDRGGVLVSGGGVDVSHAVDAVLVGRDLRVSGVKERLTCMNGETVAVTCERVRDPSIDLGPAAPLPGALASRVSIVEARGDAPAHAWFRIDGGPEQGAAQGETVPGLAGWKLALAEYDFVLFRKGDEVSGWRVEPSERKRLFVATEKGDVHVLDRETLGKRKTWSLGKKGSIWLFFGGSGTVYAASEGGRALQVSEGGTPAEKKIGEPIRQASLLGSSLILQGRSVHNLRWDGGEPLGRVPLPGAAATPAGPPPKAAWITRGGRMFLADGRAVFQHPGVVRRDVGGEVAALLPLPDESALLALLRGDELTPPRVVVLAPDTLEIRRTLTLPKPGRVHDALLSQDASRLVVALGDRVECVHLGSGEVIWEWPAPGGGHVGFVDGGRVAMFGHASSELRVVEIDRGATESTLSLGLGDSPQLGHALAWDPWTREIALIDAAGKRALLVKDGAVRASAPFDATPTSVVFVHR